MHASPPETVFTNVARRSAAYAAYGKARKA